MKYTQEILTQVISESNSLAEVLRKLNMAITAPNYKTIRKKIKQWNIDDSMLTGKYLQNPAQPIEYYMVENSISCNSSHSFKLKLIKFGYLKEECSKCKIIEWEGEKLSLHLDHINGIRNDNRLENLRLLCPNCHSLTETYAGKKLKTRQQKYCLNCNKKISYGALKCQKCNNQTMNRDNRCKIEWPNGDDLLKMVKESNYSKVALKLGVSTNAVAKRIKKEFGHKNFLMVG